MGEQLVCRSGMPAPLPALAAGRREQQPMALPGICAALEFDFVFLMPPPERAASSQLCRSSKLVAEYRRPWLPWPQCPEPVPLPWHTRPLGAGGGSAGVRQLHDPAAHASTTIKHPFKAPIIPHCSEAASGAAGPFRPAEHSGNSCGGQCLQGPRGGIMKEEPRTARMVRGFFAGESPEESASSLLRADTLWGGRREGGLMHPRWQEPQLPRGTRGPSGGKSLRPRQKGAKDPPRSVRVRRGELTGEEKWQVLRGLSKGT